VTLDQVTDPPQEDERPLDATSLGERLNRLRHTNEQPWGAFFVGLAIRTAVVLALVGAASVVLWLWLR